LGIYVFENKVIRYGGGRYVIYPLRGIRGGLEVPWEEVEAVAIEENY